jgi:membrane fusion protein (multidrug efflux system)
MKTTDSAGESEAAGPWARTVMHVRSHRLRYGLATVLLLMVDGILFLALAPARPVPHIAAPNVMIPVRTMMATYTAVRETVTYPARIEALHDVVLAVEREGRIIELGVDKGDRVRRGQVLLQLDNRAAEAAFRRAEINLRQAADDLKRWEELRKSGSVSVTEFEGVRNRHDLARIAVDEARVDRDHGVLVSPMDGRVEERAIDVGERAVPGIPAFRVVNTDVVKVVGDLSERDVFAIAPGVSVPFQVDALIGQTFTGTVAFVASAADARSNTFRVEWQAENPGGRLKPGVIARVTVTRGVIENALAMPLSALIPEKGQYVTYVVRGGHAVRRIVTLRTIIDDLAVIQEGLAPGDRIVIEGQRLVSDGAAIAERP